jgi:WD40 repeat protein
LFAHVELGEGADRRIELRSWTLPDGPEELLDSLSAAELAGIQNLVAAPDGSGWVMARGSGVFFRPFGGRGSEKLLDVLETQASVEPVGTTGVLALDQSGNARLWSFGGGGPNRAWSIRRPADATPAVYDAAGLRVASLGPTKQSLLVWERDGLPGAKPLELRRSGSWYDPEFTFLPGGAWCAATTHTQQRLTLWPLARSYPSVVEGYEFPPNRREFAFSPDSHWLATGWKDANVRLLPVGGADPAAVRELGPIDPRYASDIRFDPEGRYLFVVSMVDGWIVPLDGGPCRLVVPKVENRQIEAGAISPSGARVATAYLGGDGPRELYVFDVATGALRSFALPRHDESTGIVDGVGNLEFLDEQTLLTAGWGGVMRWDLATGAYELLVGSPGAMWMAVSRTAGTAVTADANAGVVLRNLSTGASQPLPQFQSQGQAGDLDPSGTVFATGDLDGSIRVGRVDGGETHLLLGHTGPVTTVVISPDLRWIASAGEDRTLRLWPMPDLTKPPLHTLPHDELMAKLRSLTNLRAVRDPASDGGWTIELDPFPGWREVPTW